MIKEFEDESYLEVKEVDGEKDNCIVSICARDSSNINSIILLSVKISKKDLENLMKGE